MKNHEKWAIKSIKIITVFILAFVVSSVVLINMIINQQLEDTQKTLYEVAIRSQKIIKDQLKRDFNEINTIAYILSRNQGKNFETIVDFIKEENKSNSFKSIAVIRNDGIGYEVREGELYKLSDEIINLELIQRGLKGETLLSHTEEDDIKGENVNYYVTPIKNNDDILGVVVGIIDNSILTDMIAGTTLGVNSTTRIIESSTGDLVTKDQFESDKVKMEEEEFRSINKKVQDTKSNVFSCQLKQGEMWITYIPMGINDWNLLSIVPQQDAIEKHKHIVEIAAICVVIVITGFCSLIYCIIRTEKSKEKEISNLAYYDRLTGCFNKDKFKKEAIRLATDEEYNYGIVFIDVVNFKLINEIFSYENGNKLLRYMSKVIKEELGEGEVYFRNNDDKFGLLLKIEDRSNLLKRLRYLEEQIISFSIKNNQKYNINLKFGIYILDYINNNKDFEICLDRAEIALVKAKKTYNNHYEFYDETMHKNTVMKQMVENNAGEDIESKGFTVYLQPKYDLMTETISGAEALVRWDNKEYGRVSPNEFIPIFEENGFIIQLDRYVLIRVCRMINYWKEKGYPVFPVSVNQSRVHFYQENYIDDLKYIIETEKIDPKMIIIEITENLVMENLAVIKDTVKDLKDLGFSVSMDDFGSGYSSLNILKNLFIDELKLDKKFLEDSSDSYRGEKIIAKIIELAKALSIKTVSEGVETERQVHFLRSVGCDIAQGYFFAKPMPIDEFESKIFHKEDI